MGFLFLATCALLLENVSGSYVGNYGPYAFRPKLFWPKSTILLSKSGTLKSVKICGLDFRIWLITWAHNIFEFIGTPYFLRINSQFRSENPTDNIWHRNRKIWCRIFLQISVKLWSSLKQKSKLRFQKTLLEGYTKHIFTKLVLLTSPHLILENLIKFKM